MSCTQKRASYWALTLLATPARSQLSTTQIGAHRGLPTRPMYLSPGTGYPLICLWNSDPFSWTGLRLKETSPMAPALLNSFGLLTAPTSPTTQLST